MESMNRTPPATQFTAKVVWEALNGQRTVHELASRSGVQPAQIPRWTPPWAAGVEAICARGPPKRARAEAARRARRSQEMGPLKVERDWLKRQVSPR
jgi:hypothetical protein